MTTITRTPEDTLQNSFDLGVQDCVANILAAWDSATDDQRTAGMSWYAVASEYAASMAEESGVSIETAAAVIAHLSPRTRWNRNIVGARALLTTGTAPHCMSTNVARARQAIDSPAPLDTIHGPKTRSFAANILGDMEAVTVDMWAMVVATGSANSADNERAIARVGVYAAVAHAYRLAASQVGVTPAAMQAVTWVATRGRAE